MDFVRKILLSFIMISAVSNLLSFYPRSDFGEYAEVKETPGFYAYKVGVAPIGDPATVAADAREQQYSITNNSANDIAITINPRVGDSRIATKNVPAGNIFYFVLPEWQGFPLRVLIKRKGLHELKTIIDERHTNLTYTNNHELVSY